MSSKLDERLNAMITNVDVAENLNKILAIIDALEERVAALEGGE